MSNFLFRRSAIHAEAPEFVEMSTEQEILVTGIKVVDLLAPYAKGGKIGMLHWVLTSISEVVVYFSANVAKSEVHSDKKILIRTSQWMPVFKLGAGLRDTP